MRISPLFRANIITAIGTAFLTTAKGDELERISVSVQTATFWAVPFWISLQEGFFEELGLDVGYEVFSSGAPQVAAGAEDKSWDVGAAGSVPNVIGALQGIQLIAISNDESEVNALVGNANGVAQWPPESMDGVPVAVTPNSTAHFAVLKCLTDQYPNATDFEFIYEPQSLVVRSLTPDEEGVSTADYGSLWAPDLYSFLDSVEGSRVVCNGKQVGTTVPGGIMVREEFGEEKPDVVARFLAGWIRGIGYMLNPDRRQKSEEYLREYNAKTLKGYNPTAGHIENDFTLRPFFELDEQLELFDRSKGKAEVDTWYEAVSAFLVDNNVISTNPPVESYITDKYLKMIEANDTLRDFAARSSSGYVWPEELQGGNEEESSSSPIAQAFAVGLLVSLNCLVILFV